MNFLGSAYYVFRNQNFAGKTPGVVDSLRKKLSSFDNKTYGFTIGGPIIKNKAFFFLNVEKAGRQQAATFTLPVILPSMSKTPLPNWLAT